MTDIQLTQGTAYALTSEEYGIQVLQGPVYALANEPAPGINIAQGAMYAGVSGEFGVSVLQSAIYCLTKTSRGASKVRAWGFNLDGHEFYLIRLGETETLVYDRTTKSWSRWQNPGVPYFRPHLGQNWQGLSEEQIVNGDGTPRFTWNVVGGDDTRGLIWMVDPEIGYDDNAVTGSTYFTRKTASVFKMRQRTKQRCNFVHLTASLGNPAVTSTDIRLRTSDDQGETWTDHGNITVETGNTTQEILWSSLGLISASGRIFELTDSGAAVRFSSLDME